MIALLLPQGRNTLFFHRIERRDIQITRFTPSYKRKVSQIVGEAVTQLPDPVGVITPVVGSKCRGQEAVVKRTANSNSTRKRDSNSSIGRFNSCVVRAADEFLINQLSDRLWRVDRVIKHASALS